MKDEQQGNNGTEAAANGIHGAEGRPDVRMQNTSLSLLPMSARSASALLLCLMLAGCGSYSGGTPSPVPAPAAPAPTPTPAPSPSPSSTASVSITQFGLIPFEANVIVGGRVTFVNNDNVPHDIQGGPDPEHRDCPEIDIVGFLTPGQSRQTNPLPTARTCQYHDHTVHDDHHGFEGRIVIH